MVYLLFYFIDQTVINKKLEKEALKNERRLKEKLIKEKETVENIERVTNYM